MPAALVTFCSIKEGSFQGFGLLKFHQKYHANWKVKLKSVLK